MRQLKRFTVIAVLLLVSASGASAQPAPGVPIQTRPVYSPYLNLARRDASPAMNYYGLVRPQIAAQNSLLALQQQVASQQQQLAGPAGGQPAVDPGLPITGQPTYFLNTGGYFLNYRAGGAPTSPSATTRSLTAPPRPQSRMR